MLTRIEYEKLERQNLAPYAQKSGMTKGRRYPEKEHRFRTVYQRDRDRIVHCRAFRRLEYKTQVFVNHEGDHYRTRLTHTMEVASIGRVIARILRLNEDLTEAIALVHDVGHPPFGHTGEYTLNGLMAEHGGFEHNLQSLRVVDHLERKYPDFTGLNLSWEVREGIVKHLTEYDISNSKEPGLKKNPSLEAQIINFADEIAYNTHDIDDGLAAGLVSEDQLNEIELWSDANEAFRRSYPDIDPEVKIYYSVRNLINFLVLDLVKCSQEKISQANVTSPDDVRNYPKMLISFSSDVGQKLNKLKKFLYDNLYQHPRVDKMNQKTKKIIEDLFHIHLQTPSLLTETGQIKLKTEPPHRVVCDYIAGMTDRYAINRHNEIFKSAEKLY